jgi:predicted permease
MLINYFKVALRNIFRQKGYSLINITGLAIGMACCILLLLWVQDELSYDKFHKNAKNIYRVEQDLKTASGLFHIWMTSTPMGLALKEEIPEINNISRSVNPGTLLVRYKDNSFFEKEVQLVDPSFLQIFTFPLIKGNPETALNLPTSIVINKELAKKYFGDEDPLGKSILVNNSFPFTVTGVFENIPRNSTIQADILMPFEFAKNFRQFADTWGTNSVMTWVKINDNSKISLINDKMTNLVAKNQAESASGNPTPEQIKQYRETIGPSFILMPLTSIELYAYWGYGQLNGSIQSVYIFTALAFLVLIIACINFISLSTARSANRAKEVGIRKVVGAHKNNIIKQFFTESILITIIAFAFALNIVLILLPLFSELSGKKFDADSLFNIEIMIGLFVIIIFTGIASGSYPAFFLSLFQPIAVLKGKIRSGIKSRVFRKLLVVTQFSLSIILLIGTIAVYQQMQFMRNKKLGYEKEHLLYLPLRGEVQQFYNTLKEELLKDQRVLGVSGSWQTPTNMSAGSDGFDWDGKNPNNKPMISFGSVDFNYVETMKIEIAEGRSFSSAFSTDSSNAVLINEELAKLIGTQTVVGKRFTFSDKNGTIIGIMKNYHYQAVQNNIEPLALYIAPKKVRFIIVRLSEGDLPSSIEKVKSTWQKLFPSYPFEYRFFDDDFEKMYRADERIGTLLKYAAILSIFIACLGLFGLASFMAEQRTKEIGIRKVLGASVSGITFMLSKEFVQWVIIANIVADPIAYFLTKRWLQDYAYRITISWWVFGFAVCITLAVAMLTIGWQTIKAARANPANSIKYE